MNLDLSLLSPEVQMVIARGNFDEICNMAELVRERDQNTFKVLQAVIEAIRSWSDFEVKLGPKGIDEGAELFQKLAKEKRNVTLTLDRAREVVRYVYMFERAFNFDPVNFFLWLLDRAKERSTQPTPVSRA